MKRYLEMSALFDFYGNLLSDNQKDVVDLYYNQDYTLQEIADELGITRQGVHDHLKRSDKKLVEYENILSLSKKFHNQNVAFEEISRFVEIIEYNIENSKSILDSVNEIKKIIKNISEEE